MRPPGTVGAGQYPVTMRVSAEDATAQTKVELDITGQPRLSIAGREGRMSAEAIAGKEASIPVVVTNTGTAPAEEVELSGSGPTGWKITFEPKTIDRIPRGRPGMQANREKMPDADCMVRDERRAAADVGNHEVHPTVTVPVEARQPPPQIFPPEERACLF